MLQKFTRSLGRQTLILKKNSPHIFFAAGVAGGVASVVLACRATLKLSDTLDEIKKDIDNVARPRELDSDQQVKQDLFMAYGKASWKLTKLYAPAAIVGAASITALTGSHVQMSRRNASIMAAYAVLQKAYDDYRARVQHELGDEKERELYRGEKIKIVEDGDEKGIASVTDPNHLSPYAKIFDEYSNCWEPDPELNRLFVQAQMNYANNKLQARGHLFLNEVYDSLGIDRTRAGSVVGWVIGGDGDNFVDFGIYEPGSTRFINGWERSIVLDFNVDGVIWDKI